MGTDARMSTRRGRGTGRTVVVAATFFAFVGLAVFVAMFLHIEAARDHHRRNVEEAVRVMDIATDNLINQHVKWAPPKLARELLPRPEWDPSSPDYDLASLWNTASADEIFEREPRLEPWATKMEKALIPRIRADFGKAFPDMLKDGHGKVVLDFECHTATCRLSYPTVSDPKEERAINSLFGLLYPFTNGTGPGHPGPVDFASETEGEGANGSLSSHEIVASYLKGPEFPGHYRPEKGNAEDLLREFDETRMGILEDIRKNTAPSVAYEYVTREQWMQLLPEGGETGGGTRGGGTTTTASVP